MKFNELKAGDFVIVNNEGDLKQGEITAINTNEKQICVNNGTQDFWYELDQLSPIPLNEEQLLKTKIHKTNQCRWHCEIFKRCFPDVIAG
jgi:hypothetical protein